MPFTFRRFPLQCAVTYIAGYSMAKASVEPVLFLVAPCW